MPQGNGNRKSGGCYCAVVGCHRNATADRGQARFFSFPKRNLEQRELWIQAVHRVNPDGSLWKPTATSKICSDHFVSGKWSPTRNDPNYVPSKFKPVQVTIKSNKDLLKLKRCKDARSSAKKASKIAAGAEYPGRGHGEIGLADETSKSTQMPEAAVGVYRVGFKIVFEGVDSEVTVEKVLPVCHKATQYTTSSSTSSKDVSVQTGLSVTVGGLDFSLMTTRQFKAFTGIERKLFDIVLDMAFDELKTGRKVQTDGRLTLFLMKLKLNPSFFSLGGIFNLRREEAASQIFSEVLAVMVRVAKTGAIWHSKDRVRARVPVSYRAFFPDAKVVIDCCEIPCERPMLLKERTLVYDHHLCTHSLKFLVGCVPSGEIMFVSETFGGGTTNMEALVKSGIVALIEDGDAVLVDRGVPYVETDDDGAVNRGIFSLETRERVLSSAELKQAYAGASARAHVERCISRMKRFEILHFARICDFKHIDDVLYVISYLCNMGIDPIE